MVLRELKRSDNLNRKRHHRAGYFEKFCPLCGYRIRVTEEKYCHGCGLPIKQPEQFTLTHDEVKNIPIIGKNPLDIIIEHNQDHYKKETWISGSYYLIGFSNVITIGLVEAGMANPYCLPIVLSSSLLITAFFGACQLRHTRAHRGATFSSLLSVALKQFLLSLFSGKTERNRTF